MAKKHNQDFNFHWSEAFIKICLPHKSIESGFIVNKYKNVAFKLLNATFTLIFIKLLGNVDKIQIFTKYLVFKTSEEYT